MILLIDKKFKSIGVAKMHTIEYLKLSDGQLNKLSKIAKNEGITINEAIKIYVSIKVNYRKAFDISNLKCAFFENIDQANTFKTTMETEGYIVFEPHYAVMLRDTHG
jgi:hypothetical protein